MIATNAASQIDVFRQHGERMGVSRTSFYKMLRNPFYAAIQNPNLQHRDPRIIEFIIVLIFISLLPTQPDFFHKLPL